MAVSSINRLGGVCLVLMALLLALSAPLRCFPKAAAVAAVSACAGGGLGLALAMITRTRRPFGIYFWLAVAALTFAPIFRAWPPADSFDVEPWRGAPDILFNYFDFLRGGVYLLAMPFPFARLGLHGPDAAQTDRLNEPETRV